MPDETTAQSAARTEQFEIVEPIHVPVAYVDWFINVSRHLGDVYINLGTVDQTRLGSDDKPTVAVATKLRMSQDFAMRLHRFLGEALGLTEPPSDETPNNTPPPKNLIH